ncbi:MAG: hypothetical protein R3E87_21415 [Burkholderiaceae bacterium]
MNESQPAPAGPAPAQDTASVEARLTDVKAKRGYLLPHHGLMAVLSPSLLAGYDAAYTALALEHKVLGVCERETVWLAVLIATDEAIATHHIRKYLDAGGTIDGFAAINQLTATAMGAGAWRFVDAHWVTHLPGYSPEAAYREAVTAAAGPIPPRLHWPAVCAVHAARGDFELLRWGLRAAYAAQVPEPELGEAISIMMFPGSVPRFVEAAEVWLRMIQAGEVAPSPAFAAWAALDGQGGFDEASRRG